MLSRTRGWTWQDTGRSPDWPKFSGAPAMEGRWPGRSVTYSGLNTVPLAAAEPCCGGMRGRCCYDPGVRRRGLTPGSCDGDYVFIF